MGSSEPLRIPRRSRSRRIQSRRLQKPARRKLSKEISASKSTRGACGSSRQRKVAGCNQRVGRADMAEKESLVKSLQRAQAQAVVPPVSEQIISTQGFRDESLEAVAQGEKRLEELQSQLRRRAKWQICKDHERCRTGTGGSVPSRALTWMEDRQKDIRKPSARETTVGLSY